MTSVKASFSYSSNVDLTQSNSMENRSAESFEEGRNWRNHPALNCSKPAFWKWKLLVENPLRP